MRSNGAKRDANEREIIEAFESRMCCVKQLSGAGVPDLVVFIPGIDETILVEVKDATGRLTAAQKKWHSEWRGKVYLVRIPLDATMIVDYRRSVALTKGTSRVKVSSVPKENK